MDVAKVSTISATTGYVLIVVASLIDINLFCLWCGRKVYRSFSSAKEVMGKVNRRIIGVIHIQIISVSVCVSSVVPKDVVVKV